MNADTSPVTVDLDRDSGFVSQDDIEQIYMTQSGSAAVDVTLPEGQNVVRVPVIAGSTIRLPFEDDDLSARFSDDNGNLAIKSGDTTIILLGYSDAVENGGVNVVDTSGDAIDVAATVATTDPNLDIQTAAGPGAGDLGTGVDNNGGVFAPFDPSAGIGGLAALGGLGATALSYSLIEVNNEVFIPEDAPATEAAVVDLQPINYNDANSGEEKTYRDTNVMIVLDTSFTMNEDSNQTLAGLQKRIDVAKAVLSNLLLTYEALGDVAVTIVTFNTGASQYFSWGSVADAIAALNSPALIAEGLTNYAAALDTAADAWTAGGKLPGDTNDVVYFVSDGLPQERGPDGKVHDTHLTDAQKDAWDSFLENPANGIDHVYAVGIGDDISASDPDLVSVARPDGNNVPPGDVISVTDPSADLSSVLISTVEEHPVSGNVLTGVDTSGDGDNGTPGQPDVDGDGANHIYTLSYDGAELGYSIEATWDGTSANLVVTGGQNVVENNLQVSFDTEYGRMTFDFATGDYVFTPSEVEADTDVVFHYGTKDADGDVDVKDGVDADTNNSVDGGADLVITIINTPEPSIASEESSAVTLTSTTTNEHELALLMAS